jgi:hypothetical protein
MAVDHRRILTVSVPVSVSVPDDAGTGSGSGWGSRTRHPPTAPAQAALTAELADRDEVLRCFEEAIASEVKNSIMSHSQPFFESPREDPEFLEIVQPKG